MLSTVHPPPWFLHLDEMLLVLTQHVLCNRCETLVTLLLSLIRTLLSHSPSLFPPLPTFLLMYFLHAGTCTPLVLFVVLLAEPTCVPPPPIDLHPADSLRSARPQEPESETTFCMWTGAVPRSPQTAKTALKRQRKEEGKKGRRGNRNACILFVGQVLGLPFSRR